MTTINLALAVIFWSCSEPDERPNDQASSQVSATPLRDYDVSQVADLTTGDIAVSIEDGGVPSMTDQSVDEVHDGMITDGMITDGMITDGMITDGMITDGMTIDAMTPDVAVTPVMNLLDPYLPIPGCVAYFNGECLIYQAQSDQERCDQWVDALTPPPSQAPLSDLDDCALEVTPESALQQAQEYLNLLRLWLQLPPVVVEQSLSRQQCAFIAQAVVLNRWNSRNPCYSAELNRVYSAGCGRWIRGGWTALEVLELTQGLSRLSLTPAAVERRHSYYDATLTRISTGQYQNVNSLAFDFNSLLSAQRPFSLYPGVGALPLELVSEGNQYRMPVPWSVALRQLVSGSLEYSVTQLAPTNQQIEIGRVDDFSDLGIFAFNLGREVREGDVYLIEMSWRDESGLNTAQAYLTFKDCGYVIPNIDCQPLNQNSCVMPGLSCVPRDGQWLCSRRGSIGAYGNGCQTTSHCQEGLLCYDNQCVPYCDPSPDGRNACAQRCPRGAQDVRVDGVDLGVCLED